MPRPPGGVEEVVAVEEFAAAALTGLHNLLGEVRQEPRVPSRGLALLRHSLQDQAGVGGSVPEFSIHLLPALVGAVVPALAGFQCQRTGLRSIRVRS